MGISKIFTVRGILRSFRPERKLRMTARRERVKILLRSFLARVILECAFVKKAPKDLGRIKKDVNLKIIYRSNLSIRDS